MYEEWPFDLLAFMYAIRTQHLNKQKCDKNIYYNIICIWYIKITNAIPNRIKGHIIMIILNQIRSILMTNLTINTPDFKTCKIPVEG